MAKDRSEECGVAFNPDDEDKTEEVGKEAGKGGKEVTFSEEKGGRGGACVKVGG